MNDDGGALPGEELQRMVAMFLMGTGLLGLFAYFLPYDSTALARLIFSTSSAALVAGLTPLLSIRRHLAIAVVLTAGAAVSWVLMHSA